MTSTDVKDKQALSLLNAVELLVQTEADVVPSDFTIFTHDLKKTVDGIYLDVKSRLPVIGDEDGFDDCEGEIEIVKSRYWGVQDPDMDRVLEAMMAGEDIGNFEFVPSRREAGTDKAEDGDDWLFPEAEFSHDQENEWDPQTGSDAPPAGAGDGQSFIAQAMASMLAAFAGRQGGGGGGENKNSSNTWNGSRAEAVPDSDDDDDDDANNNNNNSSSSSSNPALGGGDLREVERQFFEAVSRGSSGAPGSRSMDDSSKPFSSFLPAQPAVIRMGDGLKDLDLDKLLATVTGEGSGSGSGSGGVQPTWRPDRDLVEMDHDLDELVVVDEHGDPAPIRQTKPQQVQVKPSPPVPEPSRPASAPTASATAASRGGGGRGGGGRGGGRGGGGRGGGGRVSSARGATATAEPLDSDDSDDDDDDDDDGADLLEQRRRFKAQREAEAAQRNK